MNIRSWLVFLLMAYAAPSLSWNAMGHRIIMQIALDNMTPHAIQRFNDYNQVQGNKEGQASLLDAACWLDACRRAYRGRFDHMHYIDIPFSEHIFPLLRAHKPALMNALIAIEQSRAVLLENNVSPTERAISLRILLHVVGDVHQPLHAATRISKKYPNGDKGGNQFYLQKNGVAKNLHAYWDRGGGSLLVKSKRSMTLAIKNKAHDLEKQWPCHDLSVKFEPQGWIEESYLIAKSKAYSPLKKHRPTRLYQTMVKELTDERLSLAGCRLAFLLNEIDKTLSIAL